PLPRADPRWLVAVAACAISSMLGFVRALWAVFDGIVPWRRALVLGLAEQGANVLLPAGGAGGPAFGAYVVGRGGGPAGPAGPRSRAPRRPLPRDERRRHVRTGVRGRRRSGRPAPGRRAPRGHRATG